MTSLNPRSAHALLAVLALTLGILAPTRTLAAEWTDPVGDVSSPNADLISGSATISEGMVDLRVQFADTPFPTTLIQSIIWYFDIDQNPSTTAPGHPRGADLALTVLVPGLLGAFGVPGVDLCTDASVDPGTNTVRILFPADLLPAQAGFHYTVGSIFGFGPNDLAPNSFDFTSLAGFFASDGDDLPPFDGRALCMSVELDVNPGSTDNAIRLDRRKPVKVAILSRDGFSAPTDTDRSSLSFGTASPRDFIVGTRAEMERATEHREGSPLACIARDLSGDGREDLVCAFDPLEMGFIPGDTMARLEGRTLSGTIIFGMAEVTVVARK